LTAMVASTAGRDQDRGTPTSWSGRGALPSLSALDSASLLLLSEQSRQRSKPQICSHQENKTGRPGFLLIAPDAEQSTGVVAVFDARPLATVLADGEVRQRGDICAGERAGAEPLVSGCRPQRWRVRRGHRTGARGATLTVASARDALDDGEPTRARGRARRRRIE
jgi:hypothetical protein